MWSFHWLTNIKKQRIINREDCYKLVGISNKMTYLITNKARSNLLLLSNYTPPFEKREGDNFISYYKESDWLQGRCTSSSDDKPSYTCDHAECRQAIGQWQD